MSLCSVSPLSEPQSVNVSLLNRQVFPKKYTNSLLYSLFCCKQNWNYFQILDTHKQKYLNKNALERLNTRFIIKSMEDKGEKENLKIIGLGRRNKFHQDIEKIELIIFVMCSNLITQAVLKILIVCRKYRLRLGKIYTLHSLYSIVHYGIIRNLDRIIGFCLSLLLIEDHVVVRSLHDLLKLSIWLPVCNPRSA